MEKIEVEVTAELIDLVSNQMDLVCKREDLYGRDYLVVFGDVYRDLGEFLHKWKSHRPNSPMLDICNISSEGYWHCSVITNWNELPLDVQRRVMANN